ncbi:alpha-(1,3)-fucosyltransferase fut-5-like [Dreissena polymorpha]|uniref:Fucosyltransferase n=1 Tax=Dreissena polymorpha TaxID=45954 RepID=A0A9D4N8G3_DREPO|nr:alpha-(1,3)-fucosyltransferase fut-5-like [Dreissena polymorpha]KAH3890960.1 hypothetical protein DPMN_015050 [Dreissena polymorpha]
MTTMVRLSRLLRNQKRYLVYFVVIVTAVLLLIILNGGHGLGNNNYKTVFPNANFQTKRVKKILLWTPFFGSSVIDSYRKCLQQCPAKCEVTEDKSLIRAVDAVEFHLTDIWTRKWRIGTTETITFPAYRSPDQVWILQNLEPPPHLFGNIRILNGKFNWTKWYRTDADIFAPYGVPYKLDPQEKQLTQIVPKRNLYREKSKEATIRVGNCFDPGRRYKLIDALEKHLSVDKYGSCYNNPCGSSKDPSDIECLKIMKEYKFYLAFENDNCRDYVTEKYWGSLDRDQVPIVNWKSMNRSLVIPNSYINLYDFESIEKAGKYIKKVAYDEALYNSYFDYRQHYVNRVTTCNACKVCTALHDGTRLGQVYEDIDGWVRDDMCEKVEKLNNFMKNVHGWLFFLFGL